MCPIVPTFTCVLFRTNFSFAMTVSPREGKLSFSYFVEPTTGLEPVTSSLPRKCSTTELGGRNDSTEKERIRSRALHESGRPGSNRRRSAWKADALPTELLPQSQYL